MKKRFFLAAALFIAVFVLPLTAQEGSSVFAPFVSRLQGELRNNLVRLSWQDSPDVRGPVYIFRSSFPIEGTPHGIRPVEVPYGVQSFVDEVEYGLNYYYYVAASDFSGRRYDIFINTNNMISVSVTAQDGVAQTPVPAASPEAMPPSRVWSGVSSLEVVPQDDRVIITFSVENVRSAALYRSIRPIAHTPDLLGAVIIQTRITSPFTDFPVPGIPYFYAVIDEDDLLGGTVSIVPGLNATRSPVEISMSRGAPGLDAPAQSIRAMPLPQLATMTAASGNELSANASAPVELSPQAARVLESIPVRPPVDPASRSPRVFARDLEVYTAGGEEQALSYIIRGSFGRRDWESARNELSSFLALPRSPEVTARSRFYLGQCFYFMNRPREGLFEFLAIQDLFPGESREWVQASLELIRN